VISAIPAIACGYPGSPSTTPGLHPVASPSALRSSACLDHSEEQQAQTFMRRGFGAWDFTSDARPVFRFLTVVPDQLPDQARTHNDDLILVHDFWPRNPSAVLLIPCGDLRSFGCLSLHLP